MALRKIKALKTSAVNTISQRRDILNQLNSLAAYILSPVAEWGEVMKAVLDVVVSLSDFVDFVMSQYI